MRDWLLGRRELGFELLHVRIFASWLLGGHQVALEFWKTLVLLAKHTKQNLAIGIGAFVGRLGNNGGYVGGQTEIERRAARDRNAELAERVLATD